MDARLLEELLNETEGTSLDFKSQQYPFDGATDEQKGELLKDILSFVNAWRRSDAYILIGVREVQGARAQPVGVSTHLDDAKLQQFVNSKTQRAVEFRHQVISVDGVEIDVIGIPIQHRPIFLVRDFGRLERDKVYIRRGSSTATANPDEISRMGEVTGATNRSELTVKAWPHPKQARLQFVVAIENAVGAAPARAPYLSFTLPDGLFVAEYGLDGNGNDGLPRQPRPGTEYLTPRYAGDLNVVIHGGTTLEVTKIETRLGARELPDVVEIPCQVAAENMEIREASFQVNLAEARA